MQSTSNPLYRNALPIMKNVRKHLQDIGIPKPFHHYTEARAKGAFSKYYGSSAGWVTDRKSTIKRIEKQYSTDEYTVKIEGNAATNSKPWHRYSDIVIRVTHNS